MKREQEPGKRAVTQSFWFGFVILMLITMVLFGKVFVHPGQMFWSSDIVRAHVEYKQVQWNSLHTWGQFPLWDPTGYCGKSIVGDPLPGLLYPPFWIFWVTPSPILFGFLLWFQVTLAAWVAFFVAATASSVACWISRLMVRVSSCPSIGFSGV